MECSLPVLSFRKILRLISGLSEELLFGISPEGVRLQVRTSPFVLMVDIKLEPLHFKPPKEEIAFAFEISNLESAVAFGEIDGTMTFSCDAHGEMVDFTFEDGLQESHTCLSASPIDKDVQINLLKAEKGAGVDIQLQELKRLVNSFSLLHNSIHIQTVSASQSESGRCELCFFGEPEDDSWHRKCVMILRPSHAPPSILRLQCTSGKIITASGSDPPKVRKFILSSAAMAELDLKVEIDLKYLHKVLCSIYTLETKPRFLRLHLFDAPLLRLDFSSSGIGKINFIIAALAK